MVCIRLTLYEVFMCYISIHRPTSRDLFSCNVSCVQMPQADQYTKIALAGYLYDSTAGYGNSVYSCKYHRSWCVHLLEIH
jgi:hypothetical protein